MYEERYRDGQRDPVFVCSLCLFRQKPESEDNDDRLTIIGGDLLCVDHQGYGSPNLARERYLARSPQNRIPGRTD